jgi:hypothetical protein
LKEWTRHIHVIEKGEGNNIYRILVGVKSLKVAALKPEVVVFSILKCFEL